MHLQFTVSIVLKMLRLAVFLTVLLALVSVAYSEIRAKRQYYMPYGGAGSYYGAGMWPATAGYAAYGAGYPGYNYGMWGR